MSAVLMHAAESDSLRQMTCHIQDLRTNLLSISLAISGAAKRLLVHAAEL